MKGEAIIMLTKGDIKKFLRVVKEVDVIKFNTLIKDNNLSQPAISKFINSDDYDDFISLNKLTVLVNEIYNSCGFISDMYKEIILDEKIA